MREQSVRATKKARMRTVYFLLVDIFAFILLHDLGHEISHSSCCLILNLSGGVGVGAEGKSGIVVVQHTVDAFHVYAVLEDYCKISLSK